MDVVPAPALESSPLQEGLLLPTFILTLYYIARNRVSLAVVWMAMGLVFGLVIGPDPHT